MLSTGEKATLEAHGLVRRLSSTRSIKAFDLLAETVFETVQEALNQAPASAGSVPSERDCCDLLESVLEDDPLWQQILVRHCAHIKPSMRVVLTEIAARYIIESRYVVFVTRISKPAP